MKTEPVRSLPARELSRPPSADGVVAGPWPFESVPAAAARSSLKRVLDVVLATLLLVVTAPLQLVVALAIKLTSPGPAIFTQPRIGYRCRRFHIYKFRTMVSGAERLEASLAERAGTRTFFKLDDDPRITSLGRFLRTYSIDELPQLWNVLRGEMSLVGPRPILVSDFRNLPRGAQRERFAVKPGLTGLWQVSGRSLCSDAERMRLDLAYVRRWSHGLDLRILARTVPAVLRAEGAT